MIRCRFSIKRQVMIATGVNDPLFPSASMKPPADMPEIEFHRIDSGHFAFEDHRAEIGSVTRGFLGRVMPAPQPKALWPATALIMRTSAGYYSRSLSLSGSNGCLARALRNQRNANGDLGSTHRPGRNQ